MFDLDDFETNGILHLPGAFGAEEASSMADAIWGYIEARSDIRRGTSTSWPDTAHLPAGLSLKGLKGRGVFSPALANPALAGILDAVFGPGQWTAPKRGVRVLLTFPSPAVWSMPTGWHIDAGFDAAAYPVPWLQLWAVVEPVEACGGGTLLLAGSHNLVERYRHRLRPDQLGGNATSWGRFMRQHPFLDQLRQGGSSEAPGRDLLGRRVDVEGIAVEAVEVSGVPGDIYLTHGLVFHCVSPNTAGRPRLMLTGAFSPTGSDSHSSP
ncbi:MAG: phytanoyl-CoA dioxygenase family protein [Acidimicrobiales bacterium]